MPNEDGNAVKNDVVADAITTDPAPVETPESEVVADEDLKAFDDGFDDIESTPKTETVVAEEKPKPDETETTAQPQGDTLVDPKSEWDKLSGPAQERFRQAINQKNDYERQLAELQAREAQFAQEQELLGEINPDTGESLYTPQEAERLARAEVLKQSQEQVAQERYALQVAQNQESIIGEVTQAMQHFPIFNKTMPDGSPNPQYNEKLAQLADQRLARTFVVDDNGTLVGANDSPFEILQTIAASAEAYAPQAEAAAQRATEKMLANADVSGSSSTTGSSKESDFEDFDKAWDELDG